MNHEDMKPTRNRVMCPDCWRVKMFFESREKAQRFIDFNGSELPFGGKRLRPYFCPACGGGTLAIWIIRLNMKAARRE